MGVIGGVIEWWVGGGAGERSGRRRGARLHDAVCKDLVCGEVALW